MDWDDFRYILAVSRAHSLSAAAKDLGVSQPTVSRRVAAMEIMLASPLISDLIFKGEVHQLKEVMARSNRLGMKTFDQALFDLFEDGKISYEDALRNADSRNELRLRIKLESKRDFQGRGEGAESLRLADDAKAQHYGKES